MDIDASIEIAPKVFLPPGDGLFEFDGKAIYPLSQAEADMKFSKTQMLKQVLIPVPIVPTRHTISLKGTRAKFRLKSTQTEFYMRTADGREPQLDLIRAKVKGDKRDLENLDELFQTTCRHRKNIDPHTALGDRARRIPLHAGRRPGAG